MLFKNSCQEIKYYPQLSAPLLFIGFRFLFQQIREGAAVGVVAKSTPVSYKTYKSFMDILWLARFVLNEFFGVVVALIAGSKSLFIDNLAVVFTMAVPAGYLLIGKKLSKQFKIVIMEIFA